MSIGQWTKNISYNVLKRWDFRIIDFMFVYCHKIFTPFRIVFSLSTASEWYSIWWNHWIFFETKQIMLYVFEMC